MANVAVDGQVEAEPSDKKMWQQFVKTGKSMGKTTKQIAVNAAERMTTSVQQGASKSGENATKSAQVLGGIGGAVVGLGRAAIGIPKDIARGKSKKSFEQGFAEWGPRELRAIQGEVSPGIQARHQPSVRVVTLRHGHAAHNDIGGLTSVASRDAGLTVLGKEEAVACGQILQGMEFDLVVVSPYRRCLETAALVLNGRASQIEHIIQPRAGEHNGGKYKNKNMCAVRAQVSRGDLGSEKEDLLARFPPLLFPQYTTGLQQLAPRWWEHAQPGGFETQDSFQERARMLRCWLGSLAPSMWDRWEGKTMAAVARQPTILLVAHGGILCATFETKLRPENGLRYQNCEFRAFDVCPDGYFERPQLTPTYSPDIPAGKPAKASGNNKHSSSDHQSNNNVIAKPSEDSEKPIEEDPNEELEIVVS